MTRLFEDIPETPEEGWPWLLEHRPGLFDGLELKNEPYWQYIKDVVKQQKTVTPQNKKADNERLVRDLLIIVGKHLPEEYTLADISQALTGKRTYAGNNYDRVRDIYEALENTTTTPTSVEKPERVFVFQEMAA